MSGTRTKLAKATLQLPLALSGGAKATLADYAGRWLVLYFYPKDSTPGCTTEGLDFNALLPEFAALGEGREGGEVRVVLDQDGAVELGTVGGALESGD